MTQKNTSNFLKMHEYISQDKKLNRRQKYLFAILNELLEHSDNVEYENKHLAEKNDCHSSKVSADLAVLKKLKYIRTEGESFQRRFYKGELYSV